MIKTSGMSIARNVYCNMTDQRGGWMLISYNPTNTVTVGNAYPNVWTSGAGASFSNKFCVDAQDLWYNNEIENWFGGWQSFVKAGGFVLVI